MNNKTLRKARRKFKAKNMETLDRPTSVERCGAAHMGPWMVEPKWFAQAVAAVKNGTLQPSIPAQVDNGGDGIAVDGDGFVLYYREQGVARIPMVGQMIKGDSSFGGVNSVRARKAVRRAVNDENVSAIMLHIDSPGGTVSGTGDLASDVRIADSKKPVFTYFEDLGASAAYWVGSQARKVFANPTAEIGSIGTMTYVEDSSGAYEKAGIKVHLVSTGKFKGAWVDGLKVDEEYLKEVQTEVDDLNEHFLKGVMEGRKMTKEQLMTVADGRVFIAEKAQAFGLIDEVSTLDAAMAAIKETFMNAEQFTAYAAEHPEAVAGYIEQGKKAGSADATSAERARVASILETFGLTDHPAIASIKAGHDVETAQAIAQAAQKARAEAEAKAKAELDAKSKELAEAQKALERAKFEAQGQKAIGTVEPVVKAEPADPKEAAKAKWESMSADEKAEWVNEDTFIRVQLRQ